MCINPVGPAPQQHKQWYSLCSRWPQLWQFGLATGLPVFIFHMINAERAVVRLLAMQGNCLSNLVKRDNSQIRVMINLCTLFSPGSLYCGQQPMKNLSGMEQHLFSPWVPGSNNFLSQLMWSRPSQWPGAKRYITTNESLELEFGTLRLNYTFKTIYQNYTVLFEDESFCFSQA